MAYKLKYSLSLDASIQTVKFVIQGIDIDPRITNGEIAPIHLFQGSINLIVEAAGLENSQWSLDIQIMEIDEQGYGIEDYRKTLPHPITKVLKDGYFYYNKNHKFE